MIEALERIGCLVYVIRQPVDLIIGYGGMWMLAEVKDGDKPPSRRKLRKEQIACAEMAQALSLPLLVLTSPEQAVLAVQQEPVMPNVRAERGA